MSGMNHGGMGRGGEKSKDLKASWVCILRFAKRYWPAMMIAVLASFVGTIFTIIGPDKLSELTTTITDGIKNRVMTMDQSGIDMDAVQRIGITLVCFYAISFGLSLLQGLIMAQVTQGVSKELRSSIQKKINVLPMSYFNKVSTGDVLSRVTNDVDAISQSFNQSIATLVSAITLFIGSLIMMIKTNGIMTLSAVGSTMIGFLLMMFIMGKSQKYFRKQQESIGEINGHVEEIYSGHTVVKAYNGEKKAQAEFDRFNEKLRHNAFKAQSLSGLMMPLMQFIGNFGYVAVCITGAVLALDGKIGVGVIVAFMMYVRYFTQPLSQIAQAMQSLQSAGAAGDRVFDFLDAEELEDESGKLADGLHLAKANETASGEALDGEKGHVEFSHVRFGYDPDKVIIKDFSAEAKPGQKVAIVGPTGAGKTTLINLLMRFYEVNAGSIKIDGRDINDMTREEVHDQFCMVLQETWLFEGSIRENLAFGSKNVTDAKLDQATRAVGIHHFIATLPEKYDTVLNDNMELSQGQKQQLTIARAMIENKPMLILDEATSSVDTRTEAKIQGAMDQLMHGRTSFVIAHRLSTIKNADLILVLKDGDVIESGNHEELLEKGGFYADLYNSQFEKEG